MLFTRCAVLAGCLVLQLAAVAPRLSYPPARAARYTAQSAPSQPAATQPQRAYTLPPDKLAKAIALSRIDHLLYIAFPLLDMAVLWLLLATRTAARLDAFAQRVTRRRWLQVLLFFAVLIALITLAELPLSAFAHTIGRSYGISVQGWSSWLGDQAKSLAMELVLGAPVLLLFHWLVRRWPRRYWLACWIAAVPLIVLSTFLEPLAEPIFNQYEPLSKDHPALVAQLERVAARTGTNIPPDRMFLMKASAKTNGLNAYVSGLGATKRIVVWDTTAGRIPDDEVLFIFAHESGHYVLHHIPKGLAITSVALFFVFWACARCAAWLARRFGSRWGLEPTTEPEKGDGQFSSRAAFLVLLFTVSVAGFALDPLGNAISRHFEHQADVYGQEAIHSLVLDPQKTAVSAFNHLGEAWLEDPTPSPFIEFWEYSHPSTQTRANFAAQYNPWVNGGRGEFFDK